MMNCLDLIVGDELHRRKTADSLAARKLRSLPYDTAAAPRAITPVLREVSGLEVSTSSSVTFTFLCRDRVRALDRQRSALRATLRSA